MIGVHRIDAYISIIIILSWSLLSGSPLSREGKACYAASGFPSLPLIIIIIIITNIIIIIKVIIIIIVIILYRSVYRSVFFLHDRVN